VIVWLRHGESTWNAQGRLQHRNPSPPLTDLGRAQALVAASELTERVTSLVTSPAARARETAEIVGSVLGLVVEVDDRLVERDRDESADDVGSRIRDLLDDRPGDLLLVSHGDTIAVAVELLTGRPCRVPGNAQAIVTERPR